MGARHASDVTASRARPEKRRPAMSNLDEAFILDGPAVISDEVGGETLAINLNTGAYYVVPPSALLVWSAITGGVPGRALLDGDSDPRAGALEAYLNRLVAAGLLRRAEEALAPAVAGRWEAEGLDLQEHTDMADLLGLDPIHDADEAVGWPVRRAED